jgi:hypothetical protein
MPSVPAQELPVLTDTSTHAPDKPLHWIGPNNEAIAADIERTLGMVAAHAARDAANVRASALAGERRPLAEPRQRRSLLGPLLLVLLGALLAAGAYLWQDEGEVGQSLRQAIEDLPAKVGAWRDAYDPFASVSPVAPAPRPALPDSRLTPQSLPLDTRVPAPSGTQPVAPIAPQVPLPALPRAGAQPDLPIESGSTGRADAGAGITTEPPSAPTAKAAALPESPRAACGGRANFSLLYCMEQQCERAQFADHPQCVRLRATGEVE